MKKLLSKIFKEETPADKFITVNKQALELHGKEEKIYLETLNFEKKNAPFIDFDYLFYDFQILCEFIEKYKEDLEIKYNNDLSNILDLFTLVLKFLRLWYYESCWMYLRKAFEERVNMFCLKDNISHYKDKLDRIIKTKRSDDGPMIFETNEVYKLYSYLSDNYSHHLWNFTDIKFDKQKFLEIENITIMLIITISNITLNLAPIDKINKHANDKINKQVDDYDFYWAYIWPITRSGFVSWCQFWFQNAIRFTWIPKFEFKNWDKWLDLSKWIRSKDDLYIFNTNK